MRIINPMRKYLLSLAGSALLFGAVTISSCHNNEKREKCCEGYTGTVSDTNSVTLIARNHFIRTDTITAWVNRWNANKATFPQASMVNSTGIVGVTHSFNRCIIKAIICNDSCIGLRVLTGQSADLKVHTILVGIKPDYTNLYISEPNCNDTSSHSNQRRMASWGGAEVSLDP